MLSCRCCTAYEYCLVDAVLPVNAVLSMLYCLWILSCSCTVLLYLDVCFISWVCDRSCCYSWLPYCSVFCNLYEGKAKLPDRHSCLNLHACVIQSSQSDRQHVYSPVSQTACLQSSQSGSMFTIQSSQSGSMFTRSSKPLTDPLPQRRRWADTGCRQRIQWIQPALCSTWLPHYNCP